jgi:hypothetical protein
MTNILPKKAFCLLNVPVITGNTSVHVKSLPPTSDSEKFHSLRVYNQCQKWMSETADIEPTDWGWEIKRGKLCPILMELM